MVVHSPRSPAYIIEVDLISRVANVHPRGCWEFKRKKKLSHLFICLVLLYRSIFNIKVHRETYYKVGSEQGFNKITSVTKLITVHEFDQLPSWGLLTWVVPCQSGGRTKHLPEKRRIVRFIFPENFIQGFCPVQLI